MSVSWLHRCRGVSENGFAGRYVLAVFALASLICVTMPAAPAGAAPPLTKASSVTVGNFHACAIRTPGVVGCWGYGYYGQLGNGANANSSVPVLVSGLSDAVTIDAGGNHTCAIRSDGQPVCWGWGYEGQLGDGTGVDRSAPVPVSLLPAVTAISAGSRHSCAIRPDHQAVCWGDGTQGRLGYGGVSRRYLPEEVSGLSDARAISAGADHSCAIRDSGQAVCWGSNQNGRLGDGTFIDKSTPVDVTGLDDAVAIEAGDSSSCAIRAAGQVVCWGRNSLGQLGDGTTVDSPVPVNVTGLTHAKALALGYVWACAIRVSNQISCWGGNEYGNLGDGTMTDRPAPVDVTGIPDAGSIAAGNGVACAIRIQGKAYCWGNNIYGQVANGGSAGRISIPSRILRGAFPGDTQELTVQVTGNGQGTVTSAPAGINCVSFNTCPYLFDEEETVSLTATPDPDTRFIGWSGACSGTGACEVTMDAAERVWANFELRPENLVVVVKTGDGDGTVISDPAGIDCGSDCIAGFAYGETVTLTANPDGNSVFAGWSQACSGSENVCAVTTDRPRAVRAIFRPKPVAPPVEEPGVTLPPPAVIPDGVGFLYRNRLFIRLRCPNGFRPVCRISAVALTGKRGGAPMTSQITRSVKPGKSKQGGLLIAKPFRAKFRTFADTPGKRTVTVRLRVRSGQGRKRGDVYHRLKVRIRRTAPD